MVAGVRLAAAKFAELTGQPVFPVRGKIPLQRRSWLEATTDTGDWRWCQATGYGIRLTGMTVIDIDTRTPIKTMPPHGDTLTVATGNGRHIYLAGTWADGNRAKVRPHIDIRTDRGYVVGPGSHHPNGSEYTVVNGAPIAHQDDPEMAELVEWLKSSIPNKARRTGGGTKSPKQISRPPADLSPLFRTLLARHGLTSTARSG